MHRLPHYVSTFRSFFEVEDPFGNAERDESAVELDAKVPMTRCSVCKRSRVSSGSAKSVQVKLTVLLEDVEVPFAEL